MAIRVYKPMTAGTRQRSVLTSSEITKSTPEKSLTVTKKKTNGRNNQGRITVRHRGGGVKRKYRIKVTGNVSFSLHYKVYTPVGIANYASMFRNIVFENNGFSTWIERPDNDPENIQHNVANYGGEGEDPYPTKEGKLFAGWYTDKTYDTPYLESTGYAYAKFVDEAVLSSRHQWKNDHTALRFVSSIDSIDYDCVGFIFSGTYGDKVIEETDKSVTKVYKSIYAGEQQLSPTTISDESEYFFIYTVRNMDSSIGSSWTVTPYFVTLDGTKVLGETSTFSYTP